MSEEIPSIRKSLFMKFKKCSQQGMYSMAQGNEGYSELNVQVPALLKGQIFHHAMEDFYNEIDISIMNDLGDEHIKKYIETYLPITKQPDLKKWFNWYAEYETERYFTMKKEGKLDYFKPYKQECYVEKVIDGVKRNGHFDRIDRIGEKELIIIEYKTGKSYDPQKNYSLTDLRSELEWYRSIITQLDEYKGFKIAGWKLINPTLEIIYDSKFSTLSKYSVDKNINIILEIIRGNKPPVKKIGIQCNWCEFSKECLGYDDPNHEIFGQLSKSITKEGDVQ